MRLYIAKRIFLIIPSLLFIVVLSFLLLHYAPGDPVDRVLNSTSGYDFDSEPGISNDAYRNEIRHHLGLDLPLFYFSMSSLYEKRTTHLNSAPPWQKFIPAISFQSNNQFNRWLTGDGIYTKGILRGDFGSSWISNQKVSEIISSGIKWSVSLTLFSILLAYLISIPVGLKSAANPGSGFDKTSSTVFIILYSLPSFWVATLLMLLFCNPYTLNILPSSGVNPPGGFSDEHSFVYKIIHTLPYLILPTICYTYSSFAFLSGSIRASVTGILKEDYIRTARAKGVSDHNILYRHALRNALLPMIAIFSQVFPIAVGGSVILETIFTIPGMGFAIYQSIAAHDYPVIIAVFLVTGLITTLGFLMSDILYAIADPRISYTTDLHQ